MSPTSSQYQNRQLFKMAVTFAGLTNNHFTGVVLTALFMYFRWASASNLQTLKHLYGGGVLGGILTVSFPSARLGRLLS